MPKRKRAAANPDTSAANTTLPIQVPTSTNTATDPADAPAFLNTTFSTHRASPLHVGATCPLTQARPHVLSQRLRDLLVGDVVRGIELGLGPSTAEDGVLRRAGVLEAVSLGWVRLEDLLGRYVGDDGDDADTSLESVESGLGASPGKRRGLQVSLQYENGEYTALLLPALRGGAEDADGADFAVREGDPDFLHLPLLLLRMPAPLKAVICGFLSRTFDCRISALGLGTRSLVGALECWLAESRAPGTGAMAKDVMVTLAFYAPGVLRETQPQAGDTDSDEEDEGNGKSKTSDTSMGIKAIDITVPVTEVWRFVKAGRAANVTEHTDRYGPVKRRRLGGDKDEESWTWRFHRDDSTAAQPHPFAEALAAYVRAHLALDAFHPAVRVTRVACGGFVCSDAGRVKLFGVPPVADGEAGRNALSDRLQRAVWAVFGSLVERARVRPVVRSLEVAGVAA